MKTIDYPIEPATLADVDELMAIEQNLFNTDRCSRRSFKYLIQRTTVIVVRSDETGTIAGYAILLGRKNSRKMRIYSLGVTASFRNKGIGLKLVAALEKAAKKADCTMLTLEVSDSNKTAIDLYNKCGFKQHGFRFAYYEDGGHAILMKKNLTGTL
ncbi:MAG: N-acetyltransferase [Desulforhopalus sp.]